MGRCERISAHDGGLGPTAYPASLERLNDRKTRYRLLGLVSNQSTILNTNIIKPFAGAESFDNVTRSELVRNYVAPVLYSTVIGVSD